MLPVSFSLNQSHPFRLHRYCCLWALACKMKTSKHKAFKRDFRKVSQKAKMVHSTALTASVSDKSPLYCKEKGEDPQGCKDVHTPRDVVRVNLPMLINLIFFN